MGSGFSKRKKQAREFQQEMSKMQEEMQNLEVVGYSENNLVEITLSGENSLKKITIKPECVDPDDIEGLQDLILSAFENARKKLDKNSPSSLFDNLSLDNLF